MVYLDSYRLVSGCVSVQGHGASRGRKTRGWGRRRLGFLLLFRPVVSFVVLFLEVLVAFFLAVALVASPAIGYAVAGVPLAGLDRWAAPARPPRFVREFQRLRKTKKSNDATLAERFGTEHRGRVGEIGECAPLCRNTSSRTTGSCCPCRTASGTTSSRWTRPCRTRWGRTRGRGASSVVCCTFRRPVCSFRSCWRPSRWSGRCRNRSRAARFPVKECSRVGSTRT